MLFGKEILMIDIEKELKYYEEMVSYKTVSWEQVKDNSLEMILSEFENSFQKMGKLQYKTYQVVEDIVEQLEEKAESESDYLKNKQVIQNMLHTLIGMADTFDAIYYFVEENGTEEWKRQFKQSLEYMTELMLKIGMVKVHQVQNETIVFDSKRHTAIGTCKDPDRQPNEIVRVLKSGYIYGGTVIRKAEVVLNTIG